MGLKKHNDQRKKIHQQTLRHFSNTRDETKATFRKWRSYNNDNDGTLSTNIAEIVSTAMISGHEIRRTGDSGDRGNFGPRAPHLIVRSLMLLIPSCLLNDLSFIEIWKFHKISKVMGVPLVIIHFDRCDFPLQINHPAIGCPHGELEIHLLAFRLRRRRLRGVGTGRLLLFLFLHLQRLEVFKSGNEWIAIKIPQIIQNWAIWKETHCLGILHFRRNQKFSGCLSKTALYADTKLAGVFWDVPSPNMVWYVLTHSHIYLVGGWFTPLKNMVRQLGWLATQYMGK